MLSNNIYIVGLMGSGKTSIGKLLSKTLDSEHVDIDQEIVKKTNLTISEIFKNHGEIDARDMPCRPNKDFNPIKQNGIIYARSLEINFRRI